MNYIFQTSVLIMECIELNWLCKHMKKIRCCQPAIPVLRWVKHQSFPVSLKYQILNIQNQKKLMKNILPKFLFIWSNYSSSQLVTTSQLLYCMKISRHENFAVFGAKLHFAVQANCHISRFEQKYEFRGILISRSKQKMKKVNDLHEEEQAKKTKKSPVIVIE